jgi:hypothetical protein
MRKISDNDRAKLSAEVAGLESLDLHQLRTQWKLLYEIEAPPHLSRDWLRRAVIPHPGECARWSQAGYSATT